MAGPMAPSISSTTARRWLCAPAGHASTSASAIAIARHGMTMSYPPARQSAINDAGRHGELLHNRPRFSGPVRKSLELLSLFALHRAKCDSPLRDIAAEAALRLR